MKLRHWLYIVVAAATLVMACGIYWLSSHREFADPTWLDAEKALTVQAAWIQAVFSIIAICAAIVLGEIQHNRTRAQIALDKKAKDEEKVEQAHKSAMWMLFSLAGEHNVQDNTKNLITFFCSGENKDFSHESARILAAIFDGLSSQLFLRSPLTREKVDMLQGEAHANVVKAIANAEQVQSSMHAIFRAIVAANPNQPIDKTPLAKLVSAIGNTIEKIERAEKSIQAQYKLSPVRTVNHQDQGTNGS